MDRTSSLVYYTQVIYLKFIKYVLLFKIRDRIPGKLLVDLRRPDDEEPTQDDDRPVSVRDALVFLDVACIFSPSSFPNAGEVVDLFFDFL